MVSAIQCVSADPDDDALSHFRSVPRCFDIWQAGAVLEARRDYMDWGVPTSDNIPAGMARSVVFPEGGTPHLDMNLLGLADMGGPLPPHVALLIRERIRAEDPAFRELLSLFHNGVLHLRQDMVLSLYPELRTDGLPEDRPFATFLEAVPGLSNAGERVQDVPIPGPAAGKGDMSTALFQSCAAI